jgi:hypothetical protein
MKRMSKSISEPEGKKPANIAKTTAAESCHDLPEELSALKSLRIDLNMYFP